MRISLFNASVVLLLLTMLASGSVPGSVSALGNQSSEIPTSRSTLAGDPSLESISPSSFAGGVNVPVLITGQNLDGTASALLGTVAPRNVEVISSTQVTALVPWSIAPGSYDLQVTNQSGQSATLTGAVTVTVEAPGWISNGPYGGGLNDVVVEPVDPARVYVSAGRSGLWRSENSGVNWGFSLITPFPARLQITYPVTGQPPVMYLGIDIGAGMARSLDYGQTWEEKGPPSIGGETRAYIRPGQPGWVYLSVDQNQNGDPLGGLYQSTDLGATWAMVSGTSGLRVETVAFDPDHPDLSMVIGTGDGQVYTTTDNGVTWSQQSTPAGTKWILHLAYDPQDVSVVYAATNGTGLLRSADGGATWTPTAAQPAGTELGAVVIDPRDTLSIYVSSAGNISSGDASENGVFVTHDGGAHWVKMEGLTDYPIWDMKLVRVGTGYWLYAATMNGLRYQSIPVDPSTPWERGGGVSETATIDGLNAGVEEGRVVLYIGTSGGTLPSSLASLAGPAGANSSQLIAGGVYRSMLRIHLVYLPIVLR